MMVSAGGRVFLTAEWRDLLMLNYEVAPELLRAHIPRATELDSFRGRTYVSLVGFCFRRTKLRGKLTVPFHSDFEEINLRCYVRREVRGEVRRGGPGCRPRRRDVQPGQSAERDQQRDPLESATVEHLSRSN